MSMLTETRERFLRAIVAKVSPERIAEIHFFQPIKQGGVESGIAVVVENSARVAVESGAPDVVEIDVPVVAESDAPVIAENDAADVAETDVAVVESDVAVIESDVEAVEGDVAVIVESDAPVIVENDATDVAETDILVVANDTADAERIVVITARYRLTLKGPDRGKWETNIVAEADAPLVAVDAVVRGVQRRAGDMDDPTRMDGNDVRAFLDSRPAPQRVGRVVS